MKKILVYILISLLLLSACNKNEPTVGDVFDNNNVNRVIDGNNLSGKDYLELLKNYKVRNKNIKNDVENQEFKDFLDEIFIETMESDYLNMHYNVIDYKAYGIKKPELTIGEVIYTDNPDISDFVEQIEKLQSFDFDSLSYTQQYDYEVLEYSLLETLALKMFDKYNQFFTGGSDILSTIVTNFEEFIIYDKEMLDDYLVLLKDIDRYLQDVCLYTKKQAENGLYLIDASIDYSIEYADRFTSNVDDNTLIITFNEKIDNLDFLNEEEKNNYKLENEKIVKEEVIPAFKNVSSELENYYGQATIDTNRLINIDKDYAELVFMVNSSNNEGIDKIFNDTKEAFDDSLAAFNSAIYNQNNIDNFYDAYEGKIYPLNESNEVILKFLAKNYNLNYPDIGEIKYHISYLDESSASESTVAYYMPSPIDDLNQNVIRINPNSISDDAIYKYQTIAHEGIPGHLYEHVHYYLNNPHNFRTTQSFIGYTEGYACYSQHNALDYLNLPDGTKDIIFVQEFGAYVLKSIIDMGVNYYNWDNNDVKDFLNESGYSSEMAQYLMEDAIDRVGVFNRYGTGCIEFRMLRQEAKEALGKEYDEVEFNATITKNGPLPFNILKKEVGEYINEIKN